MDKSARKGQSKREGLNYSNSESTPLLLSSSGSSGSQANVQLDETDRNHRILRHSETSDFDSSSVTSSINASGKSSKPTTRYEALNRPKTVGTYGSNKFPGLLTKDGRVAPLKLPPHALHADLGREAKYYYDIESDDPATDDQGDYGKNENFVGGFFMQSLQSQEHEDGDGDDLDDLKPKQSSLVTIFSVWNTILGSSMLTMPWGIYMAGFVPAIILILTMSALCLFTAYKLLQVHKYHGGGTKTGVMELSKALLGGWAATTAKIFSVTVLLGANIAYWILMSNFLYNSVNFLYDTILNLPLMNAVTFNNSEFNLLCPKDDMLNGTDMYENSFDNLGPVWDLYKTVPIFLALLVFPFLNFNTTTFFTKFNSLGTVAIVYLIVFVAVKSASWGVNMNKIEWEDSWILRPTFPVLAGMLSLSFFIHNIIITIMQSNRNQSKNGRDLTIAYALVTITYIIVGIVFYICFPLAKRCIEDNLLNNFHKNDGLTVGARVVLLFQLFTVYPLIAYMLRTQLLTSVFKANNYNRGMIILVNLVIVTICVLFAIFLPHVGTIIRYTGAISGLIYVFTLPSLLHLVVSYRRGTITVYKVLLYLCVPLIGVINLISQFFIQAY
ncbi:sodium-coupled neutral amino acid transporter 9-like [Trichogramma pretiosum]|uniref:sodium-coupled neutral amino acid transporter 9-like n=1 Tax=Trichogramma pretiosum TaxID=7493 RepID=UPI0006C9C414|nr:sodium-coupled neutral amino acid transporter 9-like [Trichogramma pretiosum]